MADHFKVDVLTLKWAIDVGRKLQSLENALARAIRRDDPSDALVDLRNAKADARKVIEVIGMLEHMIHKEIPKEKPAQLRAVSD